MAAQRMGHWQASHPSEQPEASTSGSEFEVDAIDVDDVAARVAAANAAAAPPSWRAQVRVHHCALQAWVARGPRPRYDLIISNPPFFAGGATPR